MSRPRKGRHIKMHPTSEHVGHFALHQSSINQKTDVFGDGLLVIFWIFTVLESGPRSHLLYVD